MRLGVFHSILSTKRPHSSFFPKISVSNSHLSDYVGVALLCVPCAGWDPYDDTASCITSVRVFFLSFFSQRLQERRELQEKREAQTVAWMSNFTGMFGGGGGGAATGSGTAARTGAAGGGAGNGGGGGGPST